MTRRIDPPLTLAELAAALPAGLDGDGAVPVTGLASLRDAGPGDVAFLARASERDAAAASRAAAFIVSDALAGLLPAGAARLRTPDPYGGYARASMLFAQRLARRPAAGVHPGAHVDASACIAPDAIVEAGAVIGAGARVGARAWIGAGSVLGERAAVGDDTRLHPRVCVLDDCSIGARGIVHAGAVIGADGFGFAPTQQAGRPGPWQKIAQLGAVRIGNDVEIGANTCIDRGALEDTVIDDGVKLDNLIQIGHGVHVGAHSALAAKVGVAGSTRIGRHVQIGGASGIGGHIDVCDHAVFSPMSAVPASVRRPAFYTGLFPLLDHTRWERVAAALMQLPQLRRRIMALERAAGGRPDGPQDKEPQP